MGYDDHSLRAINPPRRLNLTWRETVTEIGDDRAAFWIYGARDLSWVSPQADTITRCPTPVST
jgi:hypothetical protein